MTAEVQNFGCRLNIAEGEAICAATTGLDDLVVINSCAVTNEAVRQARQAVRRVARDRPGARIFVTGCAAQIDPAMFARMPQVSGVIGNREKRLPSSYNDGETVGDIFAPPPPLKPVVSGRSHARAFVEIQTGCDHRCTFCVIPFGRGNSVSAEPDAIVTTIRNVVERGQQEVVLTGVDLTSYAGGLASIVTRVLRDVPKLSRLRLSSLDPMEIDDALFDLITGEKRIMPHVHLSLQAGDDLILKRMKRRHLRRQAVQLVHRIKNARPEIALGADIIAGFPTETEAMFENSLALINDCEIVLDHIFPYSPRPGTAAARMPQVAPEIAKARAARLRLAAATRRSEWFRSLTGTVQNILIEGDGTGGHAENFAPVRVAGRPGTVIAAQITGVDADRLTGIAA